MESFKSNIKIRLLGKKTVFVKVRYFIKITLVFLKKYAHKYVL